MRAQNQLSFSDWQNFILFTKKKSAGKIFRWRFPATDGSFRRRVEVPASGAVSGERRRWWWSAAVNGGGSNGQWCKVMVVVNGEKIRKIECCSNEGCPKINKIAAMKAAKENDYSNEGYQGK